MPNLARQSVRIVKAAGRKPQRPAPRPKPASRSAPIRPPAPDERRIVALARKWLSLETAVIALAVTVALALVIGLFWFRDPRSVPMPVDAAGIRELVERIITAESSGDANLKNRRSSATGAAQFLDDTWLEAIRRHRRDLIQGRSDKEVLDLRRDASLTREIAAREVEQYAAMLRKRGLPITPGSLYLVHFAGPAGAVALLSAAETADAASLMAAADVTGKTTREKLVTANPFLKMLTVGDIKTWADRKMAVGNAPNRS